MKKTIYLLLVSLFMASNILIAQMPDTILIKTERVKGYGPFPRSLSYIQPIQDDSPWINSIPDIKGIPNDLEYLMFATEQTDFRQHTYQSYYNHKIDQERFNSCKESWNWDPSPNEYSKDFVKLDIAIATGYDSSGLFKVKVDKNNNYDLSDDEYFDLPEKIPGQNYWGRYNDLIPFEVMYEYFDGKTIKQTKTWLYLDYSRNLINSKETKPHPIKLVFDFAEHHFGEFMVNDKKYFAAIKTDRAVFRENYKIKIWNNENILENSRPAPDILRNGFVKIEDYYYRFAKASINGGIITLVKDRSVLERGGNQVGFKAINFVGKSINGKEIELSKLKGNIVYLDFWGTWCAPCREEIPKLKSIYEQYKNEKFIMIGIANDKIEDLKKYIKRNDVEWEQILQSKDKSIIADYGVVGYPTTFLIDKEGVIIEKGLRATELLDKLNKIYSK